MGNLRRRRGFERGGSFPPEQLGLARGRARDLRLQRGWERLVGPLARRLRPLELRRGTLTLAIEAGPAEQGASLREMLPTLVGRLAVLCPELGIRRFRVADGDGAVRAPAEQVALPDAIDPAWLRREPGRRTADTTTSAAAPRTVEERLDRVMQSCLTRAQKP